MKVRKRDGKIEEYNFSKIERAVIKAFQCCEPQLVTTEDMTEEELQAAKSAFNKAHNKFERSRDKFIDQLEEVFENVICDYEAQGLTEPMYVDEIHDVVQRTLIDKKQYCVAENFIKYRDRRDKERELHSRLVKGVREKAEAKNIQNQNANVDEGSFGGRQGEATRVVMKQLALDYYMSEMMRNNHLNNEIYIHDLDSYVVGMHNCLSIPFDDLLAKGFNTRQTDVRPANSVNTAFQLVAVIFQLQSLQQFGGVSATHLDWTMVPYVRKSFFKHYLVSYLKDTEGFKNLNLLDMLFDNYTERVILDETHHTDVIRNKFEDWVDENKAKCLEEMGLTMEDFYLDNKNLDRKHYQSALYDTIIEVKQAVEGMYHNLNTLQSRSGNQLPFTSINYGTCTSTEGRIVISALLNVSIEGLGQLNKTSIFPCGIFQCMKGVNRKPGDPNYDMFRLALTSTSRRLYPNYANVDWSGNAGYDKNDPSTYFSTMGCRTANGWDVNGFGQKKDGRGNICPVTLILPTLAMEAKENVINRTEKSGETWSEEDVVNEFFKILDKKIGEAKDMLIERFNWICKQSAASASFMYENHTMAGYDGKNISSALKHGTLAVGQLGLAECLQVLIHCDHTTEKGMALAIKIEKLFNTRCKEFKEKYKLNFGVYYTPAENLCKTALVNFRKKYGVIENVSDKEFFTNSMHVPVWYEMDPMQKIDIESQLTGFSNAGCITYVELKSSVKNNIDGLETIVNYAMDKDIPYFAINVPNDQCLNPECGYIGEINGACPICGCTDYISLGRVTGYLSTDYRHFNAGKIAEYLMRVKHTAHNKKIWHIEK